MAPFADDPQSPNVTHPEVLEARRRARMAELGPEAAMELRAFEAERRLVEVAAERDRLRGQLADREAQLQATRRREIAQAEQEGERRAQADALGTEIAALREELGSAERSLADLTRERDDAARDARVARELAATTALERDAAAREAAAARHAGAAAAAERDAAVREAAEARQAGGSPAAPPAAGPASSAPEAEAALAAMHDTVAAHVGALETAVALVRDRLVGAVRTLRQRLDAERAARQQAESTVVELRQELAERTRAEAELREALTALQREPSRDRLAARLEELSRAAGALREGVARQDGLAAALTALDQRVDELGARLREQLAARAALEEELEAARAERDQLAAGLQAARSDADAARTDLEAARADADHLAAKLETARATADAARAEASRLSVELEAAAPAELDAARTVAHEAEERATQLAAELDEARAAARDAEARADRLGAELEVAREAAGSAHRVAAELEAARVEATEAAAEVARLGAELARAREAATPADRLTADVHEVADLLAVAGAEAAEARAEVDRLAEELAAARAEAEALRVAQAPVVDPEAIASLRETLDQLRAESPTPVDPAVSLDLAAAAERLRAAATADAPLSDLAEAADRLEAAASASADEPEGDDAEEHAAEDAADQRARRWRADATSASAARPLIARDVTGTDGPWLRDALLALAEEDAEAAERLVTALLAVQAAAVRKPLTYDLAIDQPPSLDRGPSGGVKSASAGGHAGEPTVYRVALEPGRGRVGPAGGNAPARIAGPLTALVPLAAGGAERRLPGATVAGRRHLRRILKARRRPLPLAEIARARALPRPVTLLELLAARASAGAHPLVIDLDLGPDGRLRIAAEAGGPIVVGRDPLGPPARATLRTTSGSLPAILAGTAPDGAAEVEGDAEQVTALLAALDRARLTA